VNAPPGTAAGAASALPAAKKAHVESVKPGLSSSDGPSEPVLLEQARKALASAPAAALALTNEHAARFPHGALAQEREVIAIEALRRLHRSAEAESRSAAFAKAYPGSAHRRMVEDPPPK
jgi:hypothetical protein